MVVHPEDVLVFPRLDRSTGVLTPAQTSWRHRSMDVDGKTSADVRGRKNSVELVVERANDWRCATLPLLESRIRGDVTHVVARSRVAAR